MTDETKTRTFTLSFKETVLITAALKQTADYLLDCIKRYQALALALDEDKTLPPILDGIKPMVDGISEDIKNLQALRKRFLSKGDIT